MFSIEPFVTSNILLLSVLLFVAGIFEDVLHTWVTFTVVKRQTVTTALITFVSIVLEFTVFLSVISNLDKWPVIISYALGASVGSVGVIELQKRVTRRKKEDQKKYRTKGARKKKLRNLRTERAIKRDTKKGFSKLEVKEILGEKPVVKSIEKVEAVEKTITSPVEKKVENDGKIVDPLTSSYSESTPSI